VEADLNLRQQQSLRFLESSESFKLGLVQRQAVLEEKAQAIVEDKVQLQEAEEKMRQVQTMQVMNLM
jgi:hypothetical protein